MLVPFDQQRSNFGILTHLREGHAFIGLANPSPKVAGPQYSQRCTNSVALSEQIWKGNPAHVHLQQPCLQPKRQERTPGSQFFWITYLRQTVDLQRPNLSK